MSLTSRGYFLQTSDGKYIRSTVVTVPTFGEDLHEGQSEEVKEDAPAEEGHHGSALGSAEDATRDGTCDDQSAEVRCQDLAPNKDSEAEATSEPRDTFIFEEDSRRYRVHGKSNPRWLQHPQPMVLSLQQLRERGGWEPGLIEESWEELKVKQHTA